MSLSLTQVQGRKGWDMLVGQLVPYDHTWVEGTSVSLFTVLFELSELEEGTTYTYLSFTSLIVLILLTDNIVVTGCHTVCLWHWDLSCPLELCYSVASLSACVEILPTCQQSILVSPWSMSLPPLTSLQYYMGESKPERTVKEVTHSVSDIVSVCYFM